MAQLFNMPTLGQSMEEGTVVQWFKREGEVVAQGEKLLEIMSDKANFEVESELDGVLRKILVQADGIAAVNTPIAIFGDAAEAIDHLLTGVAGTSAANEAPPQPTDIPLDTSKQAGPGERIAQGFASPRARRAAEERGISLSAMSGLGTGVDGRIVERDVIAFAAASNGTATQPETRTRITPLAAKVADDLGIDIGDLSLGLPGSRITARDVRRQADQPVPKVSGNGEPSVVQTIPMRGMRKLIADNVARSRQTAPHVTLVTEVDMTEAGSFHRQLVPEIQRTCGTKLTYTDIIVKAVAKALDEHPLCNAALIDDEIRVYSDRNIGIAVATETGLIVPVVRNADLKSIGDVSTELKALVERCRSGRQSASDMSGGTFTITNLGALGVDSFDPILVPPQACILGVCRIAPKPVAFEGAVVIRPMMNLCLSFDHRVLDGAPAAQFLRRLKAVLESPIVMML